MAACYLKLEDWKAAVDSATTCLDRLENIIPLSQQNQDEDLPKQNSQLSKQTDAVIEISGENEEAEKEELKRLEKMDEKKNDVMRIRAKALMRRARAKSQLGGWGNLQAAEEDYKVLTGMENLPIDDKRVVQRALRELPARINHAREKETAEMMSKLISSSPVYSNSGYRGQSAGHAGQYMHDYPRPLVGPTRATSSGRLKAPSVVFFILPQG